MRRAGALGAAEPAVALLAGSADEEQPVAVDVRAVSVGRCSPGLGAAEALEGRLGAQRRRLPVRGHGEAGVEHEEVPFPPVLAVLVQVRLRAGAFESNGEQAGLFDGAIEHRQRSIQSQFDTPRRQPNTTQRRARSACAA